MSLGIDRYLEEAGFTGSVLVRKGGVTLLDRGYGYAERDEGRFNAPLTAFQIASVSKQFVAAAVLLLQEHGALSVRDSVCDWIPNCPPTWQEMSIHHLLTHTSGIGHYWGDFPEVDVYSPMAQSALMDTILGKPLRFAPGLAWRYSSPGYTLLAHIVEQAAGIGYAAVLDRLIFQPLGMRHTWAGSRAPRIQEHATGYDRGVPVPSFDLDTVSFGAGDIWSTSGDLERWNEAVSAGGLLGPASIRAMFTGHVATAWSHPGLSGIHNGYGWFVTLLDGHPMAYHLGDNAGYSCINAVFADDSVHVVVLGNDEDIEPLPIAVHVARSLFQEDDEGPPNVT